MGSPDLIQPVVGWRLWKLNIAAGHRRPGPNAPYRLYSPYQDHTLWPPGDALRADCSAHRRPSEACGCGIYGLKEQPDLWDIARDFFKPMSTDGTIVVIGEVSLWGRVIVCQRGYRAEFGYPRSLMLVLRRRQPQECDPRLWTIHHDLSAYRVPVEFSCIEMSLRPPLFDPLAPPHAMRKNLPRGVLRPIRGFFCEIVQYRRCHRRRSRPLLGSDGPKGLASRWPIG